MNIFVSDPSPVISARNLDDVRLNKMILESAQLLSTAMHVRGSTMAPYKPTHINHPCSIWTRATKGNYLWVYQHFVALLSEFYRRRGKMHACHAFTHRLRVGIERIPEGELQPFYNGYKAERDVFDAYKKTLIAKWNEDTMNGRTPMWGDRSCPDWCPSRFDKWL
jgi:hypothetical protein